MAKDVKIKVGIEVDSSKMKIELDKALNSLSKNKLKLNFDINTKELNEIKKTIDSLKNVKIGSSSSSGNAIRETSNAIKESNKSLQEQKNIYGQLSRSVNEEYKIKKQLVNAEGEHKASLENNLATVKNTQTELKNQLKSHQQSADAQQKELKLTEQRERKERELSQLKAKNNTAMQNEVNKAVSNLNNMKLDSETVDEYTKKLQSIDQTSMGHVKSEISRLNSELKGGITTSKEVAASLKTVGDSFNTLGNGILAATAPMVAGGVASVNLFKDFEYGMAKVKAVTGATEQQFEQLRNTALHFGETTVFTSTEASEALYYMGLAGWDAQESMAGLPSTLLLAQASGESLARVSDILTDSITAFGLSASDAAMFSDVLAKAQNSSNTTVSMLGKRIAQLKAI